MKPTELLMVAIIHLAAFSIAAAVIHRFSVSDPGLALMMGACCGSAAGAILYHRRERDRAPLAIKASVGGILSGMAVLSGLSSQGILHWMTYPEVVIPISVVGSFAFPWAIFGTMQHAYTTKQPHNKTDSADDL